MRTIALGLALAAAALGQEGEPAAFQKDTEATQARPAPGSDDILWMNPLKWNWVKSDRDDTEIYFHVSGRAQARMIVDPEAKTPEAQRDATLERVRKMDPKAHVAFEEKRIVNGSPVLCVQIIAAGQQEDEEIVYYGYLYGGESRSVQLFTIAPRPLLTELYVDFTSLLNGLEIRDAQ